MMAFALPSRRHLEGGLIGAVAGIGDRDHRRARRHIGQAVFAAVAGSGHLAGYLDFNAGIAHVFARRRVVYPAGHDTDTISGEARKGGQSRDYGDPMCDCSD